LNLIFCEITFGVPNFQTSNFKHFKMKKKRKNQKNKKQKTHLLPKTTDALQLFSTVFPFFFTTAVTSHSAAGIQLGKE